MSDAELLDEYRKSQRSYRDLASTIADLLAMIVRDHGVALHSVTHRVKDEASLARKLRSPGRTYGRLSDLTDLAGVRVTTYFHDQVDMVAEMVERELVIDRANSVDKRGLLDPDRFGYLSVHYIVELSPQRCALPEYRRFSGLKAEIQIRSLLQHVWAEVEHDLGYKSTRSVPSMIRRRFARLAGLLELADSEFVAIRNELTAYEHEVPGLIARSPTAVRVDKASLTAFEAESAVLRQLDSHIASLVSASLLVPDDPLYIERDLAHLEWHGISTIGALDEALHQQRHAIERFASVWLEGAKYDTLYRGIGIFYLSYVLVAQERNPSRILEWANAQSVDEASKRQALVERVIVAATKARVGGQAV